MFTAVMGTSGVVGELCRSTMSRCSWPTDGGGGRLRQGRNIRELVWLTSSSQLPEKALFLAGRWPLEPRRRAKGGNANYYHAVPREQVSEEESVECGRGDTLHKKHGGKIARVGLYADNCSVGAV